MAGKSWRPAVRAERTGRTPGEDRRSQARLVAGAVALFGAAAVAVVRLARNAPVDAAVLAGDGVYGAATVLGVVGSATAAVAVGATATDDWERVGLVSAGSFAFLTLVTDAVTVPAAGVVVAAGLLALRPRTELWSRWTAVAGGFLLALALSLGASSGLLPATARATGTAATLVALGATPLVVHPSRSALLVGVGAALAVAAATLSAPFAASASVLVVGAAIDPPLALLAAGVGGAVATAVSGATTGRTATAIGGALLLAAGVPATVPRALAVVVGARLALGPAELATVGGEDDAV
ncbi:phosphate ABC transporter permease [Halosimplex salinum]|uniref:phosphate ABC transporter permease n=1 Tax=Halosimplex salinum TaxID=1710538 RepID=UPI000F46668F|nr:phosphate ABC transporter permease [Halosimplex salinum]